MFRRVAPFMSDMLQLVINCRRKTLTLHNDKLKHIGHET
jgi:hypothetical protein